MKIKLRLDTMTEVKNFVELVSRIPKKITLEDGTGYVVSAKSLMGALYSIEWNEIWCVCDADISNYLTDFMC